MTSHGMQVDGSCQSFEFVAHDRSPWSPDAGPSHASYPNPGCWDPGRQGDVRTASCPTGARSWGELSVSPEFEDISSCWLDDNHETKCPGCSMGIRCFAFACMLLC